MPTANGVPPCGPPTPMTIRRPSLSVSGRASEVIQECSRCVFCQRRRTPTRRPREGADRTDETGFRQFCQFRRSIDSHKPSLSHTVEEGADRTDETRFRQFRRFRSTPGNASGVAQVAGTPADVAGVSHRPSVSHTIEEGADITDETGFRQLCRFRRSIDSHRPSVSHAVEEGADRTDETRFRQFYRFRSTPGNASGVAVVGGNSSKPRREESGGRRRGRSARMAAWVARRC
jgi:hypothetical protein